MSVGRPLRCKHASAVPHGGRALGKWNAGPALPLLGTSAWLCAPFSSMPLPAMDVYLAPLPLPPTGHPASDLLCVRWGHLAVCCTRALRFSYRPQATQYEPGGVPPLTRGHASAWSLCDVVHSGATHTLPRPGVGLLPASLFLSSFLAPSFFDYLGHLRFEQSNQEQSAQALSKAL